MIRPLNRTLGITVAILALSSCAKSSGPSNGNDSLPNEPLNDQHPNDSKPGVTNHAPSGAPKSVNDRAAAVKMTYIGQDRTRPPSSELMFDVVLRNPANTARWFLLTRRIEETSKPIDSPVSGVEVIKYGDPGNAIMIGDFIGSPGFKAVHLAASGEITLRGYVVETATSPDAGDHTLEFIACDDLELAGEPAAKWFKTPEPPTTGTKADVSAKKGAKVSSRTTPDFSTVPVVVSGNVERGITVVTFPSGL